MEHTPTSIFDAQSLQKYVDKEVGNLLAGNDGKKRALLVYVGADGKTKFVYAQRYDEHWRVEGAFEFDLIDKSYQGGLQVVGTW